MATETSSNALLTTLLQQRQPPSIPSRYRTVLIAASQEKAFNASSQRFRYQTSDLPGPGEYQYEEEELHQESLSRKGYGNGFASRTRRFDRIPKEARHLGPGAYDPRPLAGQSTFTASNTTRVFHRPTPIQRDTESPDANLKNIGPSTYTIQEPKSSQAGAKAMFKSTTNRGQYVMATGGLLAVANSSAAQGPHLAPGYYSVADVGKQTPAVTSVFKSKSLRSPLATGIDLPGPQNYQADLLHSNSKNFFPRSKPTAPGTTYKTPMVAVLRRLRNELESRQPGPTSYISQCTAQGHITELSRRAQLKKKDGGALSSPFYSGVARPDPAQSLDVPGPADYRPLDLGGRQSFHLKTEKKWIN